MDIDLNTWGPLTVLAVIVVTLSLVGGVVEVCTTPYTFAQFLNDILKWLGAALGLGAAIGRGFRLSNQDVAPSRATRRAARKAH